VTQALFHESQPSFPLRTCAVKLSFIAVTAFSLETHLGTLCAD